MVLSRTFGMREKAIFSNSGVEEQPNARARRAQDNKGINLFIPFKN
jgi:hypothetical protein